MQTFRVILLAVLTAMGASCSSTRPDAGFTQSDLEDIENLQNLFDSYQHVVLVCAYEAHGQRMPPGHYHRFEAKTIVVRCYKGSWTIGEKLTYRTHLESVPANWDPTAGYLAFLFVNEHTKESIGVDTGQDWDYDPKLERELEFIVTKASGTRHAITRSDS